MRGTIKLKYTGTNIGEYETEKLFNYFKDFEIIISGVEDKYFFTFDLKVLELNINTEITYSIHGLNNGDDLISKQGLFSIYIKEVLLIQTNSILIGSLVHIVESEERVDNFSFLVSFPNFNITNYFIGDYDIWVLE